jgi:hypothetical protein
VLFTANESGNGTVLIVQYCVKQVGCSGILTFGGKHLVIGKSKIWEVEVKGGKNNYRGQPAENSGCGVWGERMENFSSSTGNVV